jgi:Fur family iron response transcriptional regulator
MTGSADTEEAGDAGAVAARLRRAGVSPTVQRRRIAEVLLTRLQHLSADEILARVNERGDPVSKATVYNTLRVFLERGLVREVIVDPQRTFYDSNTEHHHHFYNEHTGELTDFSSGALRISGVPEAPAGTVARTMELVVRVQPDAAER